MWYVNGGCRARRELASDRKSRSTSSSSAVPVLESGGSKQGDAGRVGVQTSSRRLTISYQPGMRMPKFYPLRQLFTPNFRPLRGVLHQQHTTVMGMFGALGKTNLTSSNFPRRRQVSASDTLPLVSPRPPLDTSYRGAPIDATHQPAPLRVSRQPCVSFSLQMGLGFRMPTCLPTRVP
jgi:hypothetical protein